MKKNDRIGGLLRYGIPDFKMEKHLINKRMEQMRAEGVSFYPDHHIGKDFAASQLLADYDALALACGCEEPRDLPIAGRELSGVHFAMAYLPQQNRRQAGLSVIGDKILATDKHVVVIGGAIPVRTASARRIAKALSRLHNWNYYNAHRMKKTKMWYGRTGL